LVTIRQACRKRKQISGLRTHETGDRKLKTGNRCQQNKPMISSRG
jgi:hypothetical protein